MKKYEVKVYSAVVRGDDGSECSVDIGVVDVGVPFEAYWDSWIDPRIYFTMTAQELEEASVGDLVFDGDFLVEIDKLNPSVWEAEYDPDEYNEEEGVF
jgi:hypothetical protein